MVDDLGKLPGDEDLVPKRKGLRRLRKAERALQKQEQELKQRQPATTPPPKGGRKSSVKCTAEATPQPTIIPSAAAGEGRQWHRRSWKMENLLSDLAHALLTVAAGATTTNNEVSHNPEGALVGAKPVEDSRTTTAGGTKIPSAQPRGKKGKEKGRGKGDDTADGGGGEGEEAAATRRAREDREAEVRVWIEGLRETFERETYVTTAHRVAVATRDRIVVDLVDRTNVREVSLKMRDKRAFHSSTIVCQNAAWSH